MSDEVIDKKIYMEKVFPDTPVTNEEYCNSIIAAHKARTIVCFMIWKKMKELYPTMNADRVMIEAYREFGVRTGETWGKINSAAEGLYKQSSRSGYMVFQQELVELGEDYAQKNFHYCPHIEALKSLGASDEEIKFFCRKVLSSGDYGNIDPHKGFKLEFRKQIGNGDDHCEYCLMRCDG